MKKYARMIINAIDRSGGHDAGLKRAHAHGIHLTGKVKLNDIGESLFGAREEALIRLSDAPPNERHAPWTIPLKGLAIYLKGESPVNLIFVTFPYFPWTKAKSIKNIAVYLSALKATDDWQVKLNLLNKTLHLEDFHRHIGKFVIHQPISVIRSLRKYYNPHYFVTKEGQYIRFHVYYANDVIELFAEYYKQPAPINEMRKDGEIKKIGEIQLQQEITESRPYFELLDVGPNLKPLDSDEIIHLRHEMYLISNERRQQEVETLKK